MERKQPKVIVIPAKTEIAKEQAVKRQLRVAAYCRVSTEEDEQLSSYEAQKTYFTDKIMGNKEWTLVDIFADEGITGKQPSARRLASSCSRSDVVRGRISPLNSGSIISFGLDMVVLNLTLYGVDRTQRKDTHLFLRDDNTSKSIACTSVETVKFLPELFYKRLAINLI